MAKKGLSHQVIANLVLKLVSYQVRKKLGEDVVKDIMDIVGEDFQKELASQLGWNQEKIIEAFEEADKQFIKQCKSDILKQAMKSQPLARIPSLENFAAELPSTLDDAGLLAVLEQRFQKDWRNLSKTQISSAARLYRQCLDKSLASKAGQINETSIRLLMRIDNNIDELKKIIKQIKNTKTKNSKTKKADYKNFLKDIVQKQSLWQNKYTPMFANFEELTLYAQVVESKDVSKPLIKLINTTPKLIILGVAGSGKTTTLSKIALENAKKALRKTSDAFIPILLQLRNYRGSLSNLIESQLKPWGIEIESFQDDLSRGKFLLIFDGINEIPPNEKENGLSELRELISNYDNNRFLFTSRNIGFHSSELAVDDKSLIQVCEIQPLSKAQIIDYTKRSLGIKKAGTLINQLGINETRIWGNERSLAQLVRIPLWLQMVIVVFDKLKRVPRNEGDLMLKFVDDVLLKREPTKAASIFHASVKKDILSTIAFRMHEDGLTGEAPKRYVQKIFSQRMAEIVQPFDTSKADVLWEELQKNHLLVEEDEMVSWPHPLFQELFVGLNLRNLCFDDLWQPKYVELEIRFDIIRVKSESDRDFEAAITMLGILPEKVRPEALIAISFYNPSIAYQAYLKMEPEFNLDLAKEFLNRGLSYLQAYRKGSEHRNLVKTISKAGNNTICLTLANIANDCVSWEGREQALYEIWSRCKEDKKDLLNFLQNRANNDPAYQVRITALSFLMRIKQSWSKVIPFVLTSLLHEQENFEQNTRRLISHEVTLLSLFSDTLINTSLSNNTNTQSRLRAVWMMGEFLYASSAAKSTLINIIKNKNDNFELRREAIKALKAFNSIDTIKFLGNFSKENEDTRLRKEAVVTLTSYSNKKVVPFILHTLRDLDQHIAEASIDSLAKLAEKISVIKELKDCCKKNDFVLRQRAIKALSKICITSNSEIGNASAKIPCDFKNISDKVALRDIAFALKGYYPSESAEVARRLYSISNMEEQKNLLELFDELNN